VVGATTRTVCVDQRRLSATSGPAAALGVIGRCWRNVAEVDQVQLCDVYTKLHRWRAEEKRQIAAPEPLFTLFAIFGCNLCSMLSGFEHTLKFYETTITLDKVTIDFRWDFTRFEESRPINRAYLSFSWQPAKGVSIDLKARHLAATNLLNYAVTFQR